MDLLAIPKDAAELSASWLTAALRAGGALPTGRVTRVDATPFAVDVGLLSQMFRLELQYEGAPAHAPRQIVAKITAASPQSAAVSVAYHLYLRELNFYRHLPPWVRLPVPRLYYGDVDEEGRQSVLLLEALDGYTRGDQVRGAGEAEVGAVVELLADMHAQCWGRLSEAHPDWLVDCRAPFHAGNTQTYYQASLPLTLRNFGARFSPARRKLAERVERYVPRFWELMIVPPSTLVHADLRLDNLLFGTDRTPHRVVMVDFQACCRGRGPFDLGYFMSQSVPTEVRRRLENGALRRYHAALVRLGVRDYDFASCLLDYRRAIVYCLVYPVIVCGQLDPKSELVRAFGESIMERCLSAIEDARGLEVLERDL